MLQVLPSLAEGGRDSDLGSLRMSRCLHYWPVCLHLAWPFPTWDAFVVLSLPLFGTAEVAVSTSLMWGLRPRGEIQRWELGKEKSKGKCQAAEA